MSEVLRFACMVRVSTETQERQGESMRTQRLQDAADVAALKGHVVGWYGADRHEHATEGHERAELVRLTKDAAAGRLDAVMIADLDRWDRGSAEARVALDVFEAGGIRFFVGRMELKLKLPEHRFILDMTSAVGKLFAANAARKSLLNKIERAKRNLPACGRLPVGRLWDKKTSTWSIDPAARRMYQEIARRLLGGASAYALAKEYGSSHSNLCHNLRHNMGAVWIQEFNSERFNLHEKIATPVPPLLDPKTIKLIIARLEALRTYLHKTPRPRNLYLLSGRLFCAGCGRALTGCIGNSTGRRYYRHYRLDAVRVNPVKPCPYGERCRRRLRADDLERTVVSKLFDLYGSPALIRQQMDDVAPKRERLTTSIGRLEALLEENGRQWTKLLRRTYEKEKDWPAKVVDAEKARLHSRGDDLNGQLETARTELAALPDTEAVEKYLHYMEEPGKDPDFPNGHFIYSDDPHYAENADGSYFLGGNDYGTLLHLLKEDPSGQQRLALVHSAFETPQPNGSPSGVYVTPEEKGGFTFELRGLLQFRIGGRVMPSGSS
jgi:DNA invertase Pin-like site-specific DNA recombinase